MAPAETGPDLRAQELALAAEAAWASLGDVATGAVDKVLGEEEVAASAAIGALGDAAAWRGDRDTAEGAAALAMADQVAAEGVLAASLSSDAFALGTQLAGIAGQVQVVAGLLHGVGQPTLAAVLGNAGRHLRALAEDALGRAMEEATLAHQAGHIADDLATLGDSELRQGRSEYATSAGFAAASAELADEATRSAAVTAATAARSKATATATQTARSKATADAPQAPVGVATSRPKKVATKGTTGRASRKPAKTKA